MRQRLRTLFAWCLVLGMILGVVGQLLRDRSIILALLMYLPLAPMAFVALVFDLVCRGRALGSFRFSLALLGLMTLVGAALPMIGSGPSKTSVTGPDVTLLHWNVLWGGVGQPNDAPWTALRREIAARPVDLVVLSEAPPGDGVDRLMADLGPGVHRVHLEHQAFETKWYRLVVLSKSPIELVRQEPIHDGKSIVVEARVRDRLIRLLVVDAVSDPLVPRLPRLLDIAEVCRKARLSGKPIDVIVGDFNTVSQSLGWEAIEEQGYALASRCASDWRATFPNPVPLYDIDHVWIRAELPILEDRLFSNLASDHRGQVTRFRIPD